MTPVDAGKVLLMTAAALAAAGLLLVAWGGDSLLPAGHLPGDIMVEKGRWRFYLPFGTSLVVSAVLSLVIWLLSRR